MSNSNPVELSDGNAHETNEFDGNGDNESHSDQQISSMENRQQADQIEADVIANRSVQSQRDLNDTFQSNYMDFADTSQNEFIIDRDMPSDEEAAGASLHRRLVAPPNEIRSRKRQSRSRQSNVNDDEQDIIKKLRERQLELANLQVDCQKVLLENAKITQKKCMEELLYIQEQRRNLNSNE